MYILTGFISFASIVFVFVAYFSVKALNKYSAFHNQPKEHIEVIYSREYYDKLAEDCLKKEDANCCLSSVETMRIGNYGLLTKEECPEDFVSNSAQCDDSYNWCQLIMNGNLSLDFFSGGSIFTHNISIKIDDGYINYKQSTFGGNREIESLKRPISSSELESLRSIIGSTELIGLKSQNFKVIPLLPGQSYYEISLSVDKKKNKIKCGTPISTARPDSECQKSIEKLRVKLNSMLNINIK